MYSYSTTPYKIFLILSVATTYCFYRGGLSILAPDDTEWDIILTGFGLIFSVGYWKHIVQQSRNRYAIHIIEEINRGNKPPPFSLYLRPFSIDGVWKEDEEYEALGINLTKNGSNLERVSNLTAHFCPLIGLYNQNEGAENYGPGIIEALDHDSWQEAVQSLLCYSKYIIIVVGAEPGIQYEIDAIEKKYLNKTVFLIPKNVSDFKNKYLQAKELARRKGGLQYPAYKEGGFFMLNEKGEVTYSGTLPDNKRKYKKLIEELINIEYHSSFDKNVTCKINRQKLSNQIQNKNTGKEWFG